MNEEEEKAVEQLNKFAYLRREWFSERQATIILNLIIKLLKENVEKDKEIEKKDKIIDLMAYDLADYVMYYEYDKCRNPVMIKNKAEQLKEYYERKARDGRN